MKICVVTSVYALGESDRNGSFLVELHRHLRRRGTQVQVLAPSYEALPSHTVQGVPVHRFRYFFRRWENLTHGQGAPNRIRNPLYLFVAAFYIVAGLIATVRLCRRERFDAIHVNWPFPHGIWGWVASRLSGTPMVLTFHGAELALANKFAFVNPVLRFVLKRSRGVICNSSHTAAQVAKLTDRPVEVIPFGVTVNAQPVPKQANKAERELLFVGRLIPRKGVDYLLQALRGVRIPVHLHVVGDGNMKAAWEAQARVLDLEHRVTFHGVVSNEALVERYRSADAFILPAIVDERGDTEGLGVVLVEALSFGTPVIASNVGGIPDVIIHDRTGLLVPQRDPVALAEAIDTLFGSADLLERLPAAGLAHAQSYFDWDRIAGCLEAVYARAAGDPGSMNTTVVRADPAA